jgi:arabinofuranosyltransferase
LETQLQTFLLILQTYLIVHTRAQLKRPGFYLLLSLLAALSLLVRLDSAVYLSVLYVYLLYRLAFRITPPKQALALRIACLALPLSLLLGGWFFWKLSYYGELLPNTFYVKTSGLSIAYLKQGLRYLHTFFSSYLLLPLLLLPAFYAKRLLKQEGLTLSLLLCSGWLAYILYVGGDFMEFRFMVPILPLLFLLMCWSIYQLRYRWLRALLVLFILGGSLYHAQTFYYEYGIESTKRLHAHIRAEDENWAGVGKLLAKHFAEAEEPVIIATTAAGAIPYFARLPTIDMMGLNDPWIARNEKVRSPRPGHQKRASLAYLQRKNVNLIVGQPQVRPKGQFLKRPLSSKDMLELGLVAEDSLHIPASAQVLVFPLDANYEAAIIYLRQSNAVDALIAKEKLLTYPLLSAPADPKKGTLVQAME